MAVVILEAVYFGIAPLYGDRMLPGVSVDGILLSGMTGQQARQTLASAAGEVTEDLRVTLQYRDSIWLLGAEDIGAAFDIDLMVHNAAAIGHTGSFKQRMNEKRAAANRRINYNLWDYFDAPMLETRINEIRDKIHVPCIEPTLAVDCEGFAFTLGGDGYYEDGMDYSPLFHFSPGKTGIDIDTAAVTRLVLEGMERSDTTNIMLDTVAVKPRQTEETLRSDAVHLYHSVSRLADSPEVRNSNIMAALKNFDGMVIEPGRTVSFFDVVGPPRQGAGYGITPTPQEPEDGFSQAATVLYNAVLMAGCEIIERHPNEMPLYDKDYDYGLDARVKRGEYDLVFRNTTGSRLYLDCYFCYSDDRPTYVDIDVYGALPEDGSRISVRANVLGQLKPPKASYVEMPDFAEGIWSYDKELGLMVYEHVKAREGMIVQVVREWTKDGVVVGSEELYTTRYEPVQAVIYTKPS